MAVWYVSGVSLVWATRARRGLAAVFDPLGRMALTNYVSASLIVYAVNQLVDFRTMTSVGPTTVLAVAILVVQSLLSRLWLRQFTYGPVEWAWRVVTWRRWVPLRRRQPARSTEVGSDASAAPVRSVG